MAKYHGVMVTGNAGANAVWTRKITEVVDLIDRDTAVFQPRSVAGRMRVAESRYMGRVAYMFKYLAPETTDLAELLQPLALRIKTFALGKPAP